MQCASPSLEGTCTPPLKITIQVYTCITYMSQTPSLLFLWWDFLYARGPLLLAEYTFFYPLAQRCIRQIKSGPQNIIVSTVAVTVSWGLSNKVSCIFSRSSCPVLEWNSTIFPMRRNHFDKAKVSKKLLKLKQTTDVYNYT